MDAIGKKVHLSNLITVILLTILLGIIVFGWGYLRAQSPVEVVATKFTVLQQPQKPKFLFSIYETPAHRLSDPLFTAVYKNKIYVADSLNRKIEVFNYNGKYLFAIGSEGKGRLACPVCIVFVRNDIYVSDSGTGKIHVFNENGQFIKYFAEDAIKLPTGMFYKDDKFYVIDSAAMEVKVFDHDENLLVSFGKKGKAEGEFYYPYSIYVTDEGEIYIADSNNNRIQIFDRNFNFISILKGFSSPRGLAFDKAGNLYTAELLNHDVAVSNQEGKIFGRFSFIESNSSIEANMQDSMYLPTSVFIDEHNRLYVTEFGKQRILVYKLQ